MRLPTFSDIVKARRRIAATAVCTPLLESPFLNERLNARILLKPENLQRTGSFKFRGATNKIAQIGQGHRAGGVVACSSGNHAQGVAEAARLAGMPATIVMPADAPPLKIARTRRSGASVVLYDRARENRESIAIKIAEEQGALFVPPYDDPDIIAGQGTVGLELHEQAVALGAELDAVLVPCSGGGLAAGVALAIKHTRPECQVYCVEPEGFDDYRRSLESGTRQRNDRLSGSICDALLMPEPGELTFALNRTRLAGGYAVSDALVRETVAFAFSELKLVLEPGGAVALAALLGGHYRAAGKTVAAVLSGGNVDPAAFAELILG